MVSEFLDPRIVELITYVDEDGKRRVKPPYKNKMVFSVITNRLTPEGHFIVKLGVPLNGKAVLLNLPGGQSYNYTVNPQTKSVTVLDVNAIGIYMEVQVIDPTPIPRTGTEPLWDELPYDAQKSLVVAWSDMICSESFSSQVNVEFDFDMQDTLYQKLIGWRSNCGNFKGRDEDGRANAPKNRVADPLPLEPTPPIEPPVIPHDPPPPTCIDFKILTVLEWHSGQMLTFQVSRQDFLTGASIQSPSGCKYRVQLVKKDDDYGLFLLNEGYSGADSDKQQDRSPFTDIIGASMMFSDGTVRWINGLLSKSYSEMSNPALIFGDKSNASGTSPHVAIGKLGDYALFKFNTDDLDICNTSMADFNPPPPVPLGIVYIFKTIDSASGQPLTGAKFTLYKEDGVTVVAEGVTNSSGQIIFDNLPSGKYVLKETGVPAGYTPQYTLWNVEVYRGKTVTIRAVNNTIPAPPPPPPPPPPPDDDIDIDHQYDVAFVLRWENNTNTDLDFYGYVDNDPSKMVSYYKSKYVDANGTIWLDYDYTSHGVNGFKDQPEVISVLKFSNSKIYIKINNYNGGGLTQNPIVEVRKNDGTVLKTISVPLSTLNGAKKTVEVLVYDCKTKTITPKV